MRITVTDGVKDYDGKTVMNDSREGKALTLRDIFMTALNNNLPTEMLTMDQKVRSFDLSQRMSGSTTVDLTVEEAAYIKERVGVFYAPLVYGRVCELLDGKVKEPV